MSIHIARRRICGAVAVIATYFGLASPGQSQEAIAFAPAPQAPPPSIDAALPPPRAAGPLAPSFDELLRQAERSPRNAVIDAEIARAEGLAQQSRARPNPTVSALSENILGSAPYSGFGGSETTLQYSQPFELGGRRSARVAAGDAGVTVARARGHEQRLAFALELARAYSAVEAAERRIALAEDEVEEANADLRLARLLVQAGREAQMRVLQAESAVASQQAELETERSRRAAALARLAALSGRDEPFGGVASSLLAPGAAPVIGPVDPERVATVLTSEAERELAARRVMVERTRNHPEVTGIVGVRRLQRDDASAFIVGLSMPLPLFDRNRGNIAAAQAEQRAADQRREAAVLEARADTAAALALADAAEARAQSATAAVTAAQETYRLVRIGYEAGRAPLSELLIARRALGAARALVLDADIARFEARASLARLQGLTITGAPIQ